MCVYGCNFFCSWRENVGGGGEEEERGSRKRPEKTKRKHAIKEREERERENRRRWWWPEKGDTSATRTRGVGCVRVCAGWEDLPHRHTPTHTHTNQKKI